MQQSIRQQAPTLYQQTYHAVERRKSSFCANFTITVSVIIPFYRDLLILEKTIASLLLQNYPRTLFEIIVVEDGGYEPVGELISKYQSLINLSHIRQERNGYRLASARNLGLLHATGEVIVLIDFDMICPRNFLAAHLLSFHVSPFIATIGPRKFIDSSSISVEDVLTHFEAVELLPSINSISNRMRSDDVRLELASNFCSLAFPGNYFYGCNVAFRRAAAMAIGGFDEGYNGNSNYEDIDFGHRLWLDDNILVFDCAALAYHQENSIVTLEQRSEGGRVNRGRLYQKFPELKDYRHSIGQL